MSSTPLHELPEHIQQLHWQRYEEECQERGPDFRRRYSVHQVPFHDPSLPFDRRYRPSKRPGTISITVGSLNSSCANEYVHFQCHPPAQSQATRMSRNNHEYGSTIHQSAHLQAPGAVTKQSIDNILSPSMQRLQLSKRRTEKSISESTGINSPLRKMRANLFDCNRDVTTGHITGGPNVS